MEELTDIGTIEDGCADCGADIDGADWFYYADGGAVHLTFCQSCHPGSDGWERMERATAIRLTDHRDGKEFVRLVKVPDEWFQDKGGA